MGGCNPCSFLAIAGTGETTLELRWSSSDSLASSTFDRHVKSARHRAQHRRLYCCRLCCAPRGLRTLPLEMARCLQLPTISPDLVAQLRSKHVRILHDVPAEGSSATVQVIDELIETAAHKVRIDHLRQDCRYFVAVCCWQAGEAPSWGPLSPVATATTNSIPALTVMGVSNGHVIVSTGRTVLDEERANDPSSFSGLPPNVAREASCEMVCLDNARASKTEVLREVDAKQHSFDICLRACGAYCIFFRLSSQEGVFGAQSEPLRLLLFRADVTSLDAVDDLNALCGSVNPLLFPTVFLPSHRMSVSRASVSSTSALEVLPMVSPPSLPLPAAATAFVGRLAATLQKGQGCLVDPSVHSPHVTFDRQALFGYVSCTGSHRTMDVPLTPEEIACDRFTVTHVAPGPYSVSATLLAVANSHLQVAADRELVHLFGLFRRRQARVATTTLYRHYVPIALHVGECYVTVCTTEARQDIPCLGAPEHLLGMYDCEANDDAEPVFSRRAHALRFPSWASAEICELSEQDESLLMKFVAEHYRATTQTNSAQALEKEIATIEVCAEDVAEGVSHVVSYQPAANDTAVISGLRADTLYRIRTRVRGRFVSASGSAPRWSAWNEGLLVRTAPLLVIQCVAATETSVTMQWQRPVPPEEGNREGVLFETTFSNWDPISAIVSGRSDMRNLHRPLRQRGEPQQESPGAVHTVALHGSTIDIREAARAADAPPPATYSAFVRHNVNPIELEVVLEDLRDADMRKNTHLQDTVSTTVILMSGLESKLCVRELFAGSTYSFRVRQTAPTEEPTEWSRRVVVHTPRDIFVSVAGLGCDYCRMRIEVLPPELVVLREAGDCNIATHRPPDDCEVVSIVESYQLWLCSGEPRELQEPRDQEATQTVNLDNSELSFMHLQAGTTYTLSIRTQQTTGHSGPWVPRLRILTAGLPTVTIRHVFEDHIYGEWQDNSKTRVELLEVKRGGHHLKGRRLHTLVTFQTQLAEVLVVGARRQGMSALQSELSDDELDNQRTERTLSMHPNNCAFAVEDLVPDAVYTVSCRLRDHRGEWSPFGPIVSCAHSAQHGVHHGCGQRVLCCCKGAPKRKAAQNRGSSQAVGYGAQQKNFGGNARCHQRRWAVQHS